MKEELKGTDLIPNAPGESLVSLTPSMKVNNYNNIVYVYFKARGTNITVNFCFHVLSFVYCFSFESAFPCKKLRLHEKLNTV